jgi:hypothetical protein
MLSCGPANRDQLAGTSAPALRRGLCRTGAVILPTRLLILMTGIRRIGVEEQRARLIRPTQLAAGNQHTMDRLAVVDSGQSSGHYEPYDARYHHRPHRCLRAGHLQCAARRQLSRSVRPHLDPYSSDLKALAAQGFVWDEKNLDKYLENPKTVVNKAKMVFPGLRDEQDRKDVIAYLKRFSK